MVMVELDDCGTGCWVLNVGTERLGDDFSQVFAFACSLGHCGSFELCRAADIDSVGVGSGHRVSWLSVRTAIIAYPCARVKWGF